jgi:hypothetical protein
MLKIETLESRRLLSTVSVLQYGALPNDGIDDRAAIQAAINASAPGDTIAFPTGTFNLSNTLTLLGNRNYVGDSGSILKMNSGLTGSPPVARLNQGQDVNVLIQRLTFDANFVGAGLQISVNGGGSAPASHISVQNNTFENTKWTSDPGGGVWQTAGIYQPNGITDSVIQGNHFINDGWGIESYTPNNLTVSGNDFTTINGNAMQFEVFKASFLNGNNIVVSGNTGQNLGRMAIEFQGNSGSQNPIQPQFSDNVFRNWAASASPSAFGMSIVTGSGATVRGNILTGGVHGYGMEVGGLNAVVTGNVVQGFGESVAIGSAPGLTLSGNMLEGASDTGILRYNSADAPGMNIVNNTIQNPQNYGIWMQQVRGWGGSTISGNVILRTGGAWTTDATGSSTFTAINLSPPGSPASVNGNIFAQDAASPPAAFNFMGVRVNGYYGNFSGTTINSNVVLSKSGTRVGTGIYGNAPGSFDGVTVNNNTFQNLRNASGGQGGAVSASGNLAINTTSLAWLPAKTLVTTPPVARFTATPVGGTSPVTVSFDASSSTGSNGLSSFAWYFGDGGNGQGPQTSHTYNAVSTVNFTAVLLLKDQFGAYDFAEAAIQL